MAWHCDVTAWCHVSFWRHGVTSHDVVMSWHDIKTLWRHVKLWRHGVMSCDIMAWRHVTLWRHGMTSDDVFLLWHNVLRLIYQKLRKSYFSTWWPWTLTLTFKLIRDIIKVNVSAKFCVWTSNDSAVNALTDIQITVGSVKKHWDFGISPTWNWDFRNQVGNWNFGFLILNWDFQIENTHRKFTGFHHIWNWDFGNSSSLKLGFRDSRTRSFRTLKIYSLVTELYFSQDNRKLSHTHGWLVILGVTKMFSNMRHQVPVFDDFRNA